MNYFKCIVLSSLMFLGVILTGCHSWDYDEVPDIKDNDKMIAYCTRQLTQYPDDPRYYYYRGAAYFINKQPEVALPDLSRAIELDDSYVYSYYYRAASYYTLDQYPMAKPDLQKVLDLLSKSKYKYKKIEINTYDMLYIINNKEENDEQALAIASQGVKLYPDNRMLRRNQAVAYFYLNDFPKCLSIMHDLAAENPNDIEIVFNYAITMALCQDPKLVNIDEFKKYAFNLFDHFPRNYHSYFIMAKYDQVSGNFTEANQYLDESFKLYDAKIHPNLHKSMQELKDVLQAQNPTLGVSVPAGGQK